VFAEASLRAGRSNMDYGATLDVGGTPRHTSYDTSANYVGAHLGIGNRVTMNDKSTREIYARYFFTRQGGTDARIVRNVEILVERDVEVDPHECLLTGKIK